MKLVKSKFLILALCTSALLSACKEEPHNNPLLSKHKGEVYTWLWEHKNSNIDECAKHWADPKNASKTDINYCEKFASKLAQEMNYQGFLEHVQTGDIIVPFIWAEIHKNILADIQWKIDAAKRSAEIQKYLGRQK